MEVLWKTDKCPCVMDQQVDNLRAKESKLHDGRLKKYFIGEKKNSFLQFA